jgi:hypothetical protein
MSSRSRMMIIHKRQRLLARRPRLGVVAAARRADSAPADLSQQFDQQRPLRAGQSRM